jgi:hypothetical protein
MSFRTKHWVLGASILAASALIAGCGGSDDMEEEMTAAPVTPTPTPITPTGPIVDIPQTTGLIAALTAGAISSGATMTAGEMSSIGGVTFTCADDAGDNGCTVGITVTRGDDGNITDVSATWTGGMVTAAFIDPLEDMNPAGSASVAKIMKENIGAAAGAYGGDLGGLMNGTLGVSKNVMGAGAADDSMVTLTERFDPNQDPANVGYPATAMLNAAEIGTNASDDIGAEMAGAIGRMGWNHRVLHSDWGDTATLDIDGGFETVGVIYSNVAPPGDVAFTNAATTIASDTIRPWFQLEDHDLDITTPKVVEIDTFTGYKVPTENITITVEGETFAELTRELEANARAKGHYFGAPGVFECTASDGCTIHREESGVTPFAAVAGTNSNEGQWTFTPDAGAMVTLPDQDWMAFGFWLTAPDDTAAGIHRLGVFSDGMDTYNYSAATLTGKATYMGAATGYYVNRGASGMFTANAVLAADFDSNLLGGRIDNFRNSSGAYVDSDTRANPNQGQEGDWYVGLPASLIGGDGATTPAASVTGSADGVQWSDGQWSAQMYGGGDRATPSAAPSGVAGSFRAITRDLGAGAYKGVIGAFGAMMTPEGDGS